MAARIEASFAAHKPAFVGYITAGFPTRADTVPILLAMQECGVNVIEVGVPFSDPLADGGTIQKANQIALENGVTLKDCIAMVAEARAAGLTIPVVFMGYFNPFLRYGEDKLAADCAAAGVDGFIIVDLPGEDAGAFVAACDKHALAFVPLVAPTTQEDRLKRIVSTARGFIYCVSVTGVTGSRSALPAELATMTSLVKRYAKVPVAVGFGISTPEQVEEVGRLADGVVMGSAIVSTVQREGVDGLKRFLRSVVPART